MGISRVGDDFLKDGIEQSNIYNISPVQTWLMSLAVLRSILKIPELCLAGQVDSEHILLPSDWATWEYSVIIYH